jgi:hypothetical protein
MDIEDASRDRADTFDLIGLAAIDDSDNREERLDSEEPFEERIPWQ